MLKAVALALTSLCPEASGLELSVMCASITHLLSTRNKELKDQIDLELKYQCSEEAVHMLSKMGIKTPHDMLNLIKKEKELR